MQEESTATFTPVVHLEEVEVKTHEEDEEAIYKQYLQYHRIFLSSVHVMISSSYRRAKLFTFGETLLNKGTGVKSWNERGLGDMKLLK